MVADDVIVRPLVESEWQALRKLRLHALETEPGVFFSSFAEERAYGDDRWIKLASNTKPGQQAFGVFDGDELVGITAVFTDRDDPSGRTAVFAMSYLLPAYRGRGLSRKLYEARFAWVRSMPAFEIAWIAHRRSNEASRRANQHFKFVEIGAESMTWHDGQIDDDVHYELRLKP